MQKVLITGGSGFLGRHLALKLRESAKIFLASRNELNLRTVANDIGVESYPLDVANQSAVNECIRRVSPDIVIHGAATKYVDYAEKFPNECVDINVIGSQNIARASVYYGVKSVIGISTDKVTSPISNIYGHSKAVMERLFVLLNDQSETRFTCVRYGNVAWSTGSIFPIWQKMTRQQNHIVSTGPDMHRFFFSVRQAVELVSTAINDTSSLDGKILTLPMKGARIERVLDIWSDIFGNTWERGVSRFGDRVFENLIGDNELDKTFRISRDGQDYFVIDPKLQLETRVMTSAYSSINSPQLTDDEIRSLINNLPET